MPRRLGHLYGADVYDRERRDDLSVSGDWTGYDSAVQNRWRIANKQKKQKNKLKMVLSTRDLAVVCGTTLAVLAYQNGRRYYAKWLGQQARELNPLIPAQISTDDSQMDTW